MATRYVDVDAAVGGNGMTSDLTGASCAHRSLSIWEAAVQGTFTEKQEVLCQSTHANHTADTTTCLIDGSITTTSFYHDIKAAPASRAGTVWSNTKYRLEPATSFCIAIGDNYVEISGLQLTVTAGAYPAFVRALQVGAKIHHNLFVGSGAADSYAIEMHTQTDPTPSVYRNLFYDLDDGSTDCGGIYMVGSLGYARIFNNTFYNVAKAISPANTTSASLQVRNNHAFGNRGVEYTIAAGITSSNNLSEDGSADDAGGTGHLINVTTTEFVNAAAKDFHLASTSSAINNGANLGSPYDVDFDGVTVSGAWDIGAFEYVALLQVARPNGTLVAGNWTPSGAASLHAATSDQSDSAYITSGANPANDIVGLDFDGNIVAPGAGTVSLFVRMRRH